MLWKHVSDTSAMIYGVDFSPNSTQLMTGWASSTSKVVVFNVNSNTSGVMAHTGTTHIFTVDWN